MVSPIYVLITAYRSSDFIESCLNSIVSQKTPLQIRIVVGVDGCAETKKKVQEIQSNYPNFLAVWFPENKGPYITFNSLLKYVPKGAIIQRFDSDDIMHPNMIQTMYEHFPSYSKFSGISMLPKALYMELGGFQPWRCAGDTEFRQRARKLIHINGLPQLFERRQHENQLTKSEKYGFKSDIRKRYAHYIRETRNHKPFKIEMICHELEEILE